MQKMWTMAGILIAAGCALTLSATAQGPEASGGRGAAPPAAAPASGNGFAIESEILTYAALDNNSAVLACNVASLVYGAAPGPASGGSNCSFARRGDPVAPVVLVDQGSTVVADFQGWRSDMATMEQMHQNATKFCSLGGKGGSAGQNAAAIAGHTLDFTAEGQLVGLAQTALGMFGANRTRTGLAGTVEDDAVMNAVARQLRALRIPVIAPDLYYPNSLTALPYSFGENGVPDSPYFAELSQISADRDACTKVKNDEAPQISGQIENFVESLGLGGTTSSSAVAPAAGVHLEAAGGRGGTGETEPAAQGQQGQPGQPAQQGQQGQPATGGRPDSAAASRLSSIFIADGMARALGLRSAPDAQHPIPSNWRILWVKAVESGGSEWRESNVFGSDVELSGGAVVSWALFTPEGELSCSGNVYSIGGEMKLRDFKHLKPQAAAPADPPVFTSHASCGQ